LEKDTTFNEMANQSLSRSRVYGFLSQLHLRTPDEGFRDMFINPKFMDALNYMTENPDLPASMVDGLKSIKEYTSALRERPFDEALAELSVEHTRIFRGVKREYGPPPPYESVYVDDGRVMGETTVRIKAEYAKAGLAIPDSHKGEMADYIGLEMDFMRHLCSAEADAWLGGDFELAVQLKEDQARFLREHLQRWVPVFCETAISHALSGFYVGVLQLTKGFIEFEVTQIGPSTELAKRLGN
jgi:TorA maturation chaperone TorD